MKLHWHCSSCGQDEVTPREEAALRLQSIGRLKRGVRVETDLLLELARISAKELTCSVCGAAGLELRDGLPTQDDFGRRCEVCGQSIDPERLEIFPDSTRCTACQKGDERGAHSASVAEYCSSCGSQLVLVKSTKGVTRYQMSCPQCRR